MRVTLVCAGVLIAVAGCASPVEVEAPDASEVASEAPANEGEVAELVGESELDSEAFEEDAGADFAERMARVQEFFEQQQVPAGEGLTEPITPAQHEFIDRQREHIINSGGQWSEQHNQLYLALALDGCESAILSDHQVDPYLVEFHASTSPLFEMLLENTSGEEREAGVANLLSSVVFGMGYLCPEDGEAWHAAAAELYPQRFG